MAKGVKAMRTTMVFGLTDLTNDEMLVISNAIYCFMSGFRPNTDHMVLADTQKTQGELARDLYSTICRVRESVPQVDA